MLCVECISIHALLAESDRHPARHCWRKRSYFYPRSPCGERRSKKFKSCCNLEISIHALLAESDCAGPYTPVPISIFLSTLSLRRATAGSYKILPRPVFLSTLSLRRATALSPSSALKRTISIHALLAESDITPAGKVRPWAISIHALLAESDRGEHHANSQQEKFLSTLSLRRATHTARKGSDNEGISIHALLAESDSHPQRED